MSIKKEIGRRIKLSRGNKRTLQDISNATNGVLSVSRISNYEQGIRTPGVIEARALAKALGNITAAEILCVDDTSTLALREKILLDNYRATDERGKNTISRIAETQPASEIEKTG